MRYANTVALGAILLALGGCQTLSGRVVATPPANLLQPCPLPVLQGSTNGDLVRLANDRLDALEDCNAQILSIKEWADAAKKGLK